jgi:hypothetical protein
MNIALFTAAGIICFGIIWTFIQDRSLEVRHFKLLRITGIPAYVVGLTSLLVTKQVDSIVAGAVIVLAWLCFVALSGAFFMRVQQMSSREYTLIVLCGQAVFPVVIVALPGVKVLLI